VKGLESAVQELHTAFDTIRGELGSKAGVDKVEASLLDMAQMLKGATAQQVTMHTLTTLQCTSVLYCIVQVGMSTATVALYKERVCNVVTVSSCARSSAFIVHTLNYTCDTA
jgi:hypothetical protein